MFEQAVWPCAPMSDAADDSAVTESASTTSVACTAKTPSKQRPELRGRRRRQNTAPAGDVVPTQLEYNDESYVPTYFSTQFQSPVSAFMHNLDTEVNASLDIEYPTKSSAVSRSGS